MRDHTNSITTGMMILGALMILVAATSANAADREPGIENASFEAVDTAPLTAFRSSQLSLTAFGL